MSLDRVDASINLDFERASPRQEDLIEELADILREEWNYSARERVDSLSAASGRGSSSVIINWRYPQDERVLGGYAAGLLKHGWAITGMKNFMTFVAPIVETAEDDVAYRFEGDSGPVNRTYRPKPCEVCGQTEGVEYVDVELDIDVQERIEENEYIPRYWYRSIRLCDECDLPEEHTRYENEAGEPDFDPRDYPEYGGWRDADEDTEDE